MIAAVVLAAGMATRFGGSKTIALLRGQPLIQHVVARLIDGGVDHVVVVVPPDDNALMAALEGAGVSFVTNPDPTRGMASSIAAGVAALPDHAQAFFIAHGDQPLIDPQVVKSLRAVWERSNTAAVVPVYLEGHGNPVLFDRTMGARLIELEGDRGARALLKAMGDRVSYHTVGGPAPRDVDTPEDLTWLSDAR